MRALLVFLVAATAGGVCGASEPRVMVQPISIPNLPLGVVTFPNGKAINLTVGIGSGAFRVPSDPEGRLWLITDRGPNIECVATKDLLGIEDANYCGGARNGRILPLPGFAPSIYAADIGADNVARINVYLPLRAPNGKPATGLPLPQRGNAGETALTIDGKALPNDVGGLDPEALVRLSDGSFVIAEEFGPSIVKVQADGVITARYVPEPVAEELKGAGYPVMGTLPAILRKRSLGRGIEGLALSPDEKFVFAIMQGPLEHPGEDVARQSRNVRILKVDLLSGQVVAQYLHLLDDPGSFRGENGRRELTARDVRVSDLAALSDTRLVLVERINRASKIFRIDLANATLLPPSVNDENMVPALEEWQPADLASRSIVPVAKELLLDSDDVKGLPSKIEALAVISPRELLILNDNDFAVDGTKTQLLRVKFADPVLR